MEITNLRMASKTVLLLKNLKVSTFFLRNINCWTCAITKPHRKIYLKTYPTILQYPDGSTITIRYDIPIGVIKLPLDIKKLSPEEQKLRLSKRIPKTKVKIEEDIEDDFDENRYLKFIKK